MIIFLLIFLTQGQAEEMNLFGITARWEALDPKVSAQIKFELENWKKLGAKAFDPDCLWRKKDKGVCEPDLSSDGKDLQKLTDQLNAETLGQFDVKLKGKRDYGGIWQGYVLEKIRQEVSGSWILDLSGDISSKGKIQPLRPLVVTDPVFDSVAYAEIEPFEGTYLASVSRKLGSKIRSPLMVPKGNQEILKVVLFALPTFSESRLDAWATGIVAGGKRTLEHLESLKEYQGSWASLVFKPDGTPQCSRGLVCHFDKNNRRIRVDLSSH